MSQDVDRNVGQNGGDTRDISMDDSEDTGNEIQGCGNQFRRNRCEMNSSGFCVRVFNPSMCRVDVYSDNSVAGSGALANVPVTNL